MPDQGGAMNKLLAAAVLGFASFPAQAICVSDVGHTYGANLDAADHVFVAMITKATFDGDAAALQARYDAKATRDGSVAAIRAWFDYQINYDFMVMAVLKGDPKAVGHLEGRALYDAPDGRDARIAESIAWQPGMSCWSWRLVQAPRDLASADLRNHLIGRCLSWRRKVGTTWTSSCTRASNCRECSYAIAVVVSSKLTSTTSVPRSCHIQRLKTPHSTV
jgi:hypothetical protein